MLLYFLDCCFFFQAEDGIRDAQESRGLGDVYKRQLMSSFLSNHSISAVLFLSKVVFLRVLSYLLLYSYFSLMNFSPAHLTLSTRMPMTRPFILQLISILLLLLLLESVSYTHLTLPTSDLV